MLYFSYSKGKKVIKMLKTFEELTKNEEWLKTINNLKRRDTDKEFDEKCKKEYLENLKKSIDK